MVRLRGIKETRRKDKKRSFILEHKYFYCYSKPLKDFILENGERFILKATHDKTHKQYWVFESSKKIDELLAEWRLRKN